MYMLAMLLYGGPDAVMPIASVLAGIIGVLLMLWQRVIGFCRRLYQSYRQHPTKLPSKHPPSTV